MSLALTETREPGGAIRANFPTLGILASFAGVRGVRPPIWGERADPFHRSMIKVRLLATLGR